MKKITIKLSGNLIIAFILLVNSTNLFCQNSLNFDGLNDYVSVINGGVLNNLQTSTIEMWVKWNGSSQTGSTSNSTPRYGAILGRQKNSVFSNQIIALSENNPTTAKITWRPYKHNAVAITSTISPGNDWIHLAISYTSGDHKMYVNGNLVGSSSLTGTIINDIDVPFTIGAWIGDGSSFANANISEFRIWNTLRTQTEIQNNMNNTLNGNENDLIAYYSFNQGVANGDNATESSLIDSSINNNNGVLNNFNLTGITSNWVNDTGDISTEIKKAEKAEIILYPNPSNNYITIRGISNSINYTIYDSLGEKVLSGETSNNQIIEVEKLTKGMYVLKLEKRKALLFIKE